MDNKFDIRKGYSYSDYRRYFGAEYDRGEILGFKLNQTDLMDPNRQYWDLVDDKGRHKYFQLPKHVKPFTNFSPYCFNNILHRRPARTAILIVVSVGVASITCSFVGRSIFGRKDFDVDVKVIELDKAAINYQKWKANNPNKDISKELDVYTIANFAMGQTLYDATTEEAILKDKVMTIGYGHSDTNIIISHVLVDISNCFVQNYDKAMEESISFGSMSLTRFGKRDYYNDMGNKEVSAYVGEAKSSKECNWNGEAKDVYPSKDDYMAVAGKDPGTPFLYTINEETVLTDKVFDEDPVTGEKHFGNSKCLANKDDKGKITGYTIDMDLHNFKSVTRYAKRMTYLSGQTPDYFKNVHLQFVTDNDLHLQYSEVHEEYSIVLMNASGWFKTKFYYDDKARNIPNKTEAINYNNYPL